MCGIAGYVGPSPPGRERVEATLALMRHRGPDDQTARAWTRADGRSVVLLHSRLSIIDLGPQANQPFRRGSLWLAFNGELYNYLEVRKRLLDRDVGFETASDTEVLSAAIEADGWDALDGCEGMWAFAVYDEATEVLTLCRDRFGEKPLWLLRDDDGGLTFGSEPKFLFALSGRRPAVDRRHLARFLVNGYKSLHKTSASFFEGLEALEPGSLLHVSGRGERSERYWSAPTVLEREMSFDDAVAGTRERLIRSVELRLRADVPLAFLMSGGVDSLSLISIARRVLDYSVHGFTIVNRDERYEEQAMVDHAVSNLGVDHTPVELDTAGFLPKLRDLVRAHDAPVATITYYVHSLLMEHIHAGGYRVSVSGTAADELFSGYYDHHLAYLVRHPRPVGAARGVRGGVARARGTGGAQPAPVGPGAVRALTRLSGSHVPGGRRVRRLPAHPVRRVLRRTRLPRSRPPEDAHAQRAVRGGGARDPQRRRSQRDEALD